MEPVRPAGIDVLCGPDVPLSVRSVSCSTEVAPAPVLVSTAVGDDFEDTPRQPSPRSELSEEGLEHDDEARSLSGTQGSRQDFGEIPAGTGPSSGLDLEKEQSFEDVVRFIRKAHDLGEMKEVKGEFLASAFARKSHKEARSSLDFSLPLSPLLVSLRGSTNALLQDMGVNLGFSFLPVPQARDRWYYRPEATGFAAPLQSRPDVTSLTLMRKGEMGKVPISVPCSLFSSLESSASLLSEGSS